MGEELEQTLFRKEHADERKKYMQFIVEYIFSHPEGVFHSCNSGSIWEATEKAGFHLLRCTGYLLEPKGLEDVLVRLGLIEPVCLEKTEIGTKSRFYKPKISLEAAREVLKDYIS